MRGPRATVTGKTKADRIRVGDQYVQSVVSAIEATPSYQAGDTLIVVTWDESNELSVKNKGNSGSTARTRRSMPATRRPAR